jgi:hypothetical protein
MSLIRIFARFMFLLYYISVLEYYFLRLLQNCKSYPQKNIFWGNFFGILRYSQYKTEFDTLDPVIWARYVVKLIFEGVFWYSLQDNVVKIILIYAYTAVYPYLIIHSKNKSHLKAIVARKNIVLIDKKKLLKKLGGVLKIQIKRHQLTYEHLKKSDWIPFIYTFLPRFFESFFVSNDLLSLIPLCHHPKKNWFSNKEIYV